MPDTENTSSIVFNKREYDGFKDSWIRYLGYANEVGEAFRVIVPVSVVRASYVVASSYVVADSVDKGRKTWLKNVENSSKYRKSGIAFVDTLIWQGLASVVVPGFTINRICWFARLTLKKMPFLPGPIQRWGVVGIGLGAIPFIIKPIDESIHFGMDNTLRKYYFD